jgi:hypothetical protein
MVGAAIMGDWRSAVIPHSLRTVVIVTAVVLATGPVRARAQDTPPDPRGAAAPPAATASDNRGLFDEPRRLEKAMDFAVELSPGAEGGKAKNGFYPELGEMVTGAGWISAGPGYRHWLFNETALFTTSAAISWRAYKMAQARIEFPSLADDRLLLGTQVRWHDYTQVSYWGEGPDSLDTSRSQYRMKGTNMTAYGTVRPVKWLSLNARLGWLPGPELLAPGGSFGREDPPAYELFPDDPVYQTSEQPDFLFGDAAVVVDTRDHRGYPIRGGLYRASWIRFSDRDLDAFSFVRYEAEAAHFMPFAADNLVVILHGWLVGTESAAGQHVPFYLEPALGGSNTLRGYSNYRYHDRNVALVNAETRLAIWKHVDAAVFFDAGNVAHEFDDLNLENTSYGVGLRLHSETANFLRFDIARGREGWNLVFHVSDPFRFARHTKRNAPIPFAP